jgi:hypothetical protein
MRLLREDLGTRIDDLSWDWVGLGLVQRLERVIRNDVQIRFMATAQALGTLSRQKV